MSRCFVNVFHCWFTCCTAFWDQKNVGLTEVYTKHDEKNKKKHQSILKNNYNLFFTYLMATSSLQNLRTMTIFFIRV